MPNFRKNNILLSIWKFYTGGFRNMGNWGKQVWLIILIKLFIMFAVLKIFFFPNFLNANFSSDDERGNYVLEELTKSK